MKKRFLIKTAQYLDKYPRYCWASLVGVFMGFSLEEIKKPTGKGCRLDSIENEICYCGKFVNGKQFSKLSKKEQSKLKNN